jgi:hypothetical protein
MNDHLFPKKKKNFLHVSSHLGLNTVKNEVGVWHPWGSDSNTKTLPPTPVKSEEIEKINYSKKYYDGLPHRAYWHDIGRNGHQPSICVELDNNLESCLRKEFDEKINNALATKPPDGLIMELVQRIDSLEEENKDIREKYDQKLQAMTNEIQTLKKALADTLVLLGAK